MIAYVKNVVFSFSVLKPSHLYIRYFIIAE